MSDGCRGNSGWIGAGLMALVASLIVVGCHAGVSRAQGERVTRPDGPPIRGRVVDTKGKPVAGARVRLYRRESRWEPINRLVEETKTGPEGLFRLNVPLESVSPSKTRQYPRHVLLADHPGRAVGWLTIPDDVASFQGEIVLTEPIARTITVIDGEDRPVAGARVIADAFGDPASPSPHLRAGLDLKVADGPLAATTNAEGRATFSQLPRTNAMFLARKPGYAENYAFREQGSIRLTPSASLSGTVTGPAGQPLAGIKVVLFTGFMWSFEHATTDERGRYRFDDLKARGWDMSAWRPGQTGNGTYKVWLESEQFAVPTQTITLGPREQRAFDLHAEQAGVIRVTLVEAGTNKPVAGVRIWGFDKETGGSSRFNAYTDEHGRATFYSTPAEINLSVVGPPEGTYIKGNLGSHPGAFKQFHFEGGEAEVTLTMPPIAGPLLTVSGLCTKPDGSPASGATIHAGAGEFVTSSSVSYVQPRRTDEQGRFILEGVPAGQNLALYAESADRQWGGTVAVKTPDRSKPDFPVNLPLRPMVRAGKTLANGRAEVLASRKFTITPKVGDAEFPFLRRTVESDEQGKIDVDRVVSGLTYHIQEEPVGVQRVAGGGFIARSSDFDMDIVLAPE